MYARSFLPCARKRELRAERPVNRALVDLIEKNNCSLPEVGSLWFFAISNNNIILSKKDPAMK